MTKTAITINLGKELGHIANDITNVFTTKNFIKELQVQYVDHVNSFYDEDFHNDFRQVYNFIVATTLKDISKPCETPLRDIQDVTSEMQYILNNKGAYSSVLNILIGHCSRNNRSALMMKDILKLLKGDSKTFVESAKRYDQYMGEYFPLTELICSIVSYGRISGLVEFYNFQEGKDGDEEEGTS